MITLVIILILISFLQNTLISFNLVLLVLISRAFVAEDKANYYLAFAFGLLLSLLLDFPLGFLSLLYLLFTVTVAFIKKLQFSSSWPIILLISALLLLLDEVARNFSLGALSFNLYSFLPKFIIILPTYFIVKFWEERFAPKQGIKLKIGK